MLEGRIKGWVSEDGKSYELRQGETVLRTIPLNEARADKRLAAAIKRNGWEMLP